MSSKEAKSGNESAQSTQIPTEVSRGGDSETVNLQTADLQTSFVAKVGDVLAGKERINLGIDWDSLDRESLFTSLEAYDNAEDIYPKVPGERHDRFVIHTGELKTLMGGKLIVEISKVISPNFHELQIGIIRPSIGTDKRKREYRHVAGFDFLQIQDGISEEWDMKHRQTSEPYKNQGIAGKIIDLTEEILKKRSARNNLAQSISAKSGQRDLTAWLENKGFKPASEQDREMIQRLNAHDSDLQDVTATGDMYANGETYTFDTKDFKAKFPSLSGPEDPKVWNDSNYTQPFFYMKSCFKIKIKKSL